MNITPPNGSATVDRTRYRRHVSRQMAFWLVAFAFAVTMFATALPSPLYPAYEARFRLGGLMVTVIYAVFASGVLAALLLIGRASDTIGRKPVLLFGLALAVLSSTLFLFTGAAHSGGIALLIVARVLSGLSAGIFTGTATAALADLAPPGGSARAALIAALANLGGTGLGPLIGGIFAHWVALPLQAVFILHLGLIAAAIVAVAIVPETVHPSGRRRLRPERLGVPVEARAAFVPAAAAAFAGFAVSALFVAVSPALLAGLGHHNPALTGLVISAMFATAAAGTLISGALTRRNAILAGTGLLIGALAILALALARASLPLLVCAAVITGASQGLGFRAALESVTIASPPEQRGAVSSSFFAVCYVGGTSLPVLGVGTATQRFGLIHTGEAFAAIFAALATAALVAFTRRADVDGM